MIDKSSEAINAFYSYLRTVLDNPDVINREKLESEATNYLIRNPHVKDSIDFHSLVGGITERLTVVETINFGITQMLDDKTIDHEEWYDHYLSKNFNNRPYWQRFYNYSLSTGLSSVVLKGIDSSTDKILSKIENPNRPGIWSNKGLVVGVVQGGKTTNMIGLCNKAIDAGYRLIIVIPGLLEDLRLQTHERFDAGLIGIDTRSRLDHEARSFSHGVSKYNRKINVHNFTTANKRGDSINDLKNLVIKDNEHNEPSIVIVKKNTNVLQNLFSKISSLENVFKDYPVLVIDDESDLASINTNNIQDIEKVTRDEITKTPLWIRAILSLFNKSAYIGYTATPYANIFQHYREKAEKESTLIHKFKDRNATTKTKEKKLNLGEGLFPKNFICSLPVYSNYIGFEKMFGDNFYEDGHYLGNKAIKTVRDYVDNYSYERLSEYYNNLHLPRRENPKPEREEINGWMSPMHESNWEPENIYDLPDSLKNAICFFVISNIIKKIRKIKPIHNSMLINVSRFVQTNSSIRNQVQSYLNDIKSEYSLGDNKSQIQNYFKTIWSEEFENQINQDYIYPPREIKWEEIESLIPEELHKIQTLLITGDNDYLEYSRNKSVSIIAIGGTKLSRGITLEGLSVSYFLRKTVTSSSDSVTQMGRWFGYRPRYDDICKLYLTEFLLDDFREYYEAEEDLRDQLFNMNRQGLTPNEFGLRIKNLDRPVARNRMRFTERHRFDRNFSGKIKQLIFINIKSNEENIKNTKKLFESLKLINSPKVSDDSSIYFEDIDAIKVIDFLDSYKSPSAYSRFTEDSYINYIETCNGLGDELKKWNVALVSNVNGKEVNDQLIGYPFKPKTREYDVIDSHFKRKIKDWNGNPETLKEFSGENSDVYRIGVLTERSHLYLDMGISRTEADRIIKTEKEKPENLGKDFKEAVYWRKKRLKPILIIYPFKSTKDEENEFIYISYAIIFPFSKIVENFPQAFSAQWETLNPVLVDQLNKYRKIESNN